MTVTPPAATPGANRAPRWMWIALILSVALNLLIVGMVAAAIMHFRNGYGGPSARFGHYIHTLPDDRRAALGAILDEQRGIIRPLRRKSRRARRRARDVFAAEPFDRNALTAAYREASEARMSLVKARGEWFTKLAEKMTAKERREYLKWRRKHRRHRRWRKRYREDK